MNKHLHVVVNPASGKNEPILNTLNDVFHPVGVTWSASVTNAYGDAMYQAREAAKSGSDIVVAYGGDGTVMEVVNGLLGTGVPMGILPGGTGNVLSIEVGIPQTLGEAAQVLVSEEATIRQIDVGQLRILTRKDVLLKPRSNHSPGFLLDDGQYPLFMHGAPQVFTYGCCCHIHFISVTVCNFSAGE